MQMTKRRAYLAAGWYVAIALCVVTGVVVVHGAYRHIRAVDHAQLKKVPAGDLVKAVEQIEQEKKQVGQESIDNLYDLKKALDETKQTLKEEATPQNEALELQDYEGSENYQWGVLNQLVGVGIVLADNSG